MPLSDEQLTSRIVLRAVLPVIKVMLADDPAVKKAFEGVSGTIQFRAADAEGPVGACLVFEDGALTSRASVKARTCFLIFPRSRP